MSNSVDISVKPNNIDDKGHKVMVRFRSMALTYRFAELEAAVAFAHMLFNERYQPTKVSEARAHYATMYSAFVPVEQ